MIHEQEYKALRQELDPKGVKIIAVSKRQPLEKLRALYHLGHRDYGENLVQALTDRNESLHELEINWHFIGHLQTNKVKYIAPFVSMIHSIDSLKLLKEVNKQALKNNRIIDCLFQMHIAEEDTKFGLDMDELRSILDSPEYQNLKNINICGLMGMATYTDDENQVRSEFASLHQMFMQVRSSYFENQPSFKEVSMGMSGDYQIAVAEGSTMVRVGTKIFGSRTY